MVLCGRATSDSPFTFFPYLPPLYATYHYFLFIFFPGMGDLYITAQVCIHIHETYKNMFSELLSNAIQGRLNCF